MTSPIQDNANGRSGWYLIILVFLFGAPQLRAETEKYNSGWEIYLDNDAFALLNSDQDYTGGFAVALLGRRAVEYPVSLDGIRRQFDRLLGHDLLYLKHNAIQQHSMEFGLVSFTPKDVGRYDPVTNDRPYSSMVFISNSYKGTIPERRIAYHSTFTVGVLGLHVTDYLQKTIHGLLGQEGANGWGNQISEGGELTARYSFGRQKTLAHSHVHADASYELNTMLGGSIGYITEVGAGLFARAGDIHSPWWSFNPHQTENIHLGAPILSGDREPGGTERYFWTGINLKYRANNAFLQGQFRESAVTFGNNELNPWILESWVGFTRSIGKSYRFNFTIRASTPELKIGEIRSPIWGSFTLGRSI